MRKWMILTAVFLWVAGVAQVDATTMITMNKATSEYWGFMDVAFDGGNRHVGAGRFSTTISHAENQIDTFSYCVDIENTFSWDTDYIADLKTPDGVYREAAWLVSQFDPFTGSYWSESGNILTDAKSVAMTLQLAIWDTLYLDPDRFDRQNSGDLALFDTMIGTLPLIGTFVPTGFFVADISGQDQLVAAPVPEPGTMLLMGMGLLGLGVVGRRRLK
jgi:hypothetical protein